MPGVLPPPAPDELLGSPASGTGFRPPVSGNTVSSSISPPLEAYRDVESVQAPCRLEALSAYIDSPARARIIAVMALDIFAGGTPLNGHFDRWICPFSNCKQGFADPKAMILHAAKCTHVSPNGAYCNCCCEYYNFPGNGPAYRLSAGESLSPGVKTSTMAKGKKKIAGLISRCSGSASSPRGQLSPACRRSGGGISSGWDLMSEVLPASRKGSVVSSLGDPEALRSVPSGEVLAELGANYQIVELDNSTALPSRSTGQSDGTVQMQQRSAQSSSKLPVPSTTTYMDSMATKHGALDTSPPGYSAPDLQLNVDTQVHHGGIPYATNAVTGHQMQAPPAPAADCFWGMGQSQSSSTSNHDGATPSSQAAPGLEVVVPNYSHPLQVLPAGNSSFSGFIFHDSNHETAAIASVRPETQYGSKDSLELIQHQYLGHNSLGVGIAVNSMETIGIAETNEEAMSPKLRRSTGSSASFTSFRNDNDMRCQESGCTYRPTGAEAQRKANFNKHMKHMHGQRPRWSCERCGAFFTRKDNLQVHQRGVCDRRARRHSPYRRIEYSRYKAARQTVEKESF